MLVNLCKAYLYVPIVQEPKCLFFKVCLPSTGIPIHNPAFLHLPDAMAALRCMQGASFPWCSVASGYCLSWITGTHVLPPRNQPFGTCTPSTPFCLSDSQFIRMKLKAGWMLATPTPAYGRYNACQTHSARLPSATPSYVEDARTDDCSLPSKSPRLALSTVFSQLCYSWIPKATDGNVSFSQQEKPKL